jgi:hypothetical protein
MAVHIYTRSLIALRVKPRSTCAIKDICPKDLSPSINTSIREKVISSARQFSNVDESTTNAGMQLSGFKIVLTTGKGSSNLKFIIIPLDSSVRVRSFFKK